MPAIRALLIDLDGVIRLWGGDHERLIEQGFALAPGTLRAIAFAPALLEPAITGKTSDEAWRQQIARSLAEQFPSCDAAAAVGRWSTPSGAIDQQMLALSRQCRRHLPVALITNATSRLPWDLEQLQLSGEFDAIINSSAVGSAKPNNQIFQAALNALGAQPATTLFIDDTLGHVQAARGLGIIGHLYRGASDLQRLLQWRDNQLWYAGVQAIE